MDLEQQSQTKPQSLSQEEDEELVQYRNHLLKQNFSIEDLKDCSDLISSKDTKNILKATIIARKVILRENPPIQDAIDHGLVPIFIALLKDESMNSLIHIESLDVLTNICAGTVSQVRECIDADILTVAFMYLSHPKIEFQSQSIMTVGNIAADSSEHRHKILKAGILGKILIILQGFIKEKKKITEHIFWAIRNICKVETLPNQNEAMKLITAFADIIKFEVKNQEILINILYSLAYLSVDSYNQVQQILDCKILDHIIRYLGGNNGLLIVPSLSIIGGIFNGTIKQIQFAMDAPNCLKNMISLLNSKSDTIRKETLFGLSNIAADRVFAYKLIENEQTIKKIIEMALNEREIVAAEAYYVLSNASNQANIAQLQKLLDLGLLKVFFKGPGSSDNLIVRLCFQGILNIIRERQQMAGVELNQQRIMDMIEQYGFISMLENFKHKSPNLIERSQQILAAFIPDYEIDIERNLIVNESDFSVSSDSSE